MPDGEIPLPSMSRSLVQRCSDEVSQVRIRREEGWKLMGVRILHDSTEGVACFYDSTVGWAFGPLFNGVEDHPSLEDPVEEAEAFLAYLNEHVPGWRSMFDRDLNGFYGDWRYLQLKEV